MRLCFFFLDMSIIEIQLTKNKMVLNLCFKEIFKTCLHRNYYTTGKPHRNIEGRRIFNIKVHVYYTHLAKSQEKCCNQLSCIS